MFHAGLPAWKKAGHPVVSNVAAIENYDKNDASYILLDLRPKSQIEQGHIPKAVAVPEAGIKALESQLPKYKNAAIILYNQDGSLASAQDAFKAISDLGYKQTSILAGGFEAWQKAGKQVVSGPAESTIKYVRKLMPGEVELAIFKEAIGDNQKKAVILDVRASAEAKTGAIENSVNIPLDELEQRLADLPKDKPVYIYCGTGARAEMAYNVLKKAGINGKYLKCKVDFDKEDPKKYTIEE